ncbi:MAG: OmpH family outer membrane protein [Deltaproteobacteria bacterium]|nr:OmpH family outer membrane protein [Deltaproteobacteria bacterium]
MPTFKTLILFILLSTITLVLFMGTGSALAQGGFTVGVVDIRKAIGDSKQGKAASDKLESKYNALKKNLDQKQAALEKKDQDLRNQASTLSQEAFERRQQELMGEISAFREEAQRATEEMQRAFEEAMAPLGDKAQEITASIAKSRGFSMVIDAAGGAVLFVDPAYNITAEVTQQMDKSR